MTDAYKNLTGDFYDRLIKYLNYQTRILDAVISSLAKRLDEETSNEEKSVIKVTALMAQSLGVSVHSILKIVGTGDMSIRDAYGIARSSSELAVNICYIATAGFDAASRAERHAMQKSYRDLDRSGSMGGIEFAIRRDGIPSAASIAGMADAIKEFTDKKDHEVRDWTPLNVSERIKIVGASKESAAIFLVASMLCVFRHSSELLHGTYFGAIHFWSGSQNRAWDRSEFKDLWNDHFTAVFGGAFWACVAVTQTLSSKYKFSEIEKEQAEMIDIVKSDIEARNQPDEIKS